MADRKLVVKIIGDDASLNRAFLRSGRNAKEFDRTLSHATRGVAAGSGLFRSLGRSLAFASGGFIAFAGVSDLLRKSVEAAQEAGVAQKQLAQQLKNNGKQLSDYRDQIDKTNLRLSALAGFTKTDLDRSLTTILRTVPNVSKALADNALAADIARARHIGLAQAALVVAKTEAGNTTLLRRQGFQIAKNATAEQALAKVREVVAGQARAGTTAAERFNAVFHDTEVAIGTGILPTFNKYLTQLTIWLAKNNENGNTQRFVNKSVKNGISVVNGLRDAYAALVPVLRVVRDLQKEAAFEATTRLKQVLNVLSLGTLTSSVAGPTGRLSQGSRNAEDAAKAAAGKARIDAAVAAATAVAKVHVFTAIQNTIFDNAIARILLRGGLGTISQQIGALQKADVLLSQRIKATKDVTRKLKLEDQLLQNQAQITALNAQAAADAEQQAADALQKRQDAADRLRAKIVASQFRQLGLGPTGEAITPGVANLKKQVAQITSTLKGTGQLTPRLAAEIKRIRNVLAGVVPPKVEVRQKIDEMLQTIRDGLKKGVNTGNLTRFAHTNTAALLAGLGLDPTTSRILQQRLSQIGVRGTVPGRRSLAFSGAGTITTHVTLVADGKTLAEVVTPHQQRAISRRGVSRRGPYAGRH